MIYKGSMKWNNFHERKMQHAMIRGQYRHLQPIGYFSIYDKHDHGSILGCHARGPRFESWQGGS